MNKKLIKIKFPVPESQIRIAYHLMINNLNNSVIDFTSPTIDILKSQVNLNDIPDEWLIDIPRFNQLYDHFSKYIFGASPEDREKYICQKFWNLALCEVISIFKDKSLTPINLLPEIEKLKTKNERESFK